MYQTVLFIAIVLPCVLGHGFLVYPPARNSMWRDGFDTPKNYNDMGLNCGGTSYQWNSQVGKCGLCGDPFGAAAPRDHEAGGKYAPISRPISRCYNARDHVIDITVRVTAYHKGYFEFRLCVNNDMSRDPSQACLDNGYLLTVAGSPGVTRYDINTVHKEYYDFQLDMPQDVVCSQCILQWKYNTGNSWNCDAEGCGIGIGPQEQFINCADIAILPSCDGSSMTTESDTDDDDDDVTGTIIPPTDGTAPPVTVGVTGPTVGPAVLCHAVGEWANQVYMDGWCMFHCLHPLLKFCPASHCKCNNDLSANVY